jgi:gas vesicle protein
MRRFFTFLLGTMSGAIVGASIALLIAPASGEELRNRARERFADLRDELKEAYEVRSAQLQAELDEMRKRKAPEQVA